MFDGPPRDSAVYNIIGTQTPRTQIPTDPWDIIAFFSRVNVRDDNDDDSQTIVGPGSPDNILQYYPHPETVEWEPADGDPTLQGTGQWLRGGTLRPNTSNGNPSSDGRDSAPFHRWV